IEGKSESAPAPAPAAAAPAPAAAAPVAAPAAAAPVAAASVDGSASVMKNGELDWPALYQAVVPGAAAAPVA
ncbi:hypothetical protein ACTUM1_15915, partial [Listeria monocytogenes]